MAQAWPARPDPAGGAVPPGGLIGQHGSTGGQQAFSGTGRPVVIDNKPGASNVPRSARPRGGAADGRRALTIAHAIWKTCAYLPSQLALVQPCWCRVPYCW